MTGEGAMDIMERVDGIGDLKEQVRILKEWLVENPNAPGWKVVDSFLKTKDSLLKTKDSLLKKTEYQYYRTRIDAAINKEEIDEIKEAVDFDVHPDLLAVFEEKERSLGIFYAEFFEAFVKSSESLPTSMEEDLHRSFNEIRRSTMPECYRESPFGKLKEKIEQSSTPSATNNLGEPWDGTAASNSSVGTKVRDVFGRQGKRERAHLLPNAKTCCPSWGHAVEAAVGLDLLMENRSMKNRLRLAAGTKNSDGHKADGYRSDVRNFIPFQSHKELYDNNPVVHLIPLMSLDEIKGWNGGDYHVAVIIANHSGFTAEEQNRLLLGQHKDVCTPDEIEKAMESLRAFMKGLASSLLLEIPKELAVHASHEATAQSLAKTKKDIETNGLHLPQILNHNARICKIKITTSGQGKNVLPDPWMLMAKGAVNVSSLFGQKLLPACSYEEDEDDSFEVNLNYELAQRRQDSVPPMLYITTEAMDDDVPQLLATPDSDAHEKKAPLGFNDEADDDSISWEDV